MSKKFEYDMFLNHSAKYEAVVRELAEPLKPTMLEKPKETVETGRKA